ncbi:papain-like cysteine protease family protein [Leptolyngbya sp. NIES-2104]|uniref:papain-like cysteine protease family protein n=1 Tax=Leptolyngbya sp. NIES-2104 TaxID=1552121 RepID=UPI0006EC7EAB|nr:papain-like cysteine protease family protein [Leptolyngbya sp. NIES-2104]GAP93607.1 hypothetical protein NIES2104_01140 [Leptolyngbya sp. NIES-2104]
MQSHPFGAGGRWAVLDEQDDPTVIRQFNRYACAAACGEIVLLDRNIQIDQRDIAQLAGGVPMDLEDLADALNAARSLTGQWRGIAVTLPGASDEELLETLNQTGSWIAGFWEDEQSIGHAVVVDGFDPDRKLLIRDPWGRAFGSNCGSTYRMEIRVFLEVWSRKAVFYLG